MYLFLGDIGMGQLLGPKNFNHRVAQTYASHSVIEGKPILQYIGAELEEIKLDFFFHADFCQPERIWSGLVDLAASHRAFDLVQAAGLYMGRFVVNGMDRTAMHCTDDGRMVAMECTIGLIEYVDPAPLATKKQEAREEAPARKKEGEKAKQPTKNVEPAAQTQPPAGQQVSPPDQAADQATRQWDPDYSFWYAP